MHENPMIAPLTDREEYEQMSEEDIEVFYTGTYDILEDEIIKWDIKEVVEQ